MIEKQINDTVRKLLDTICACADKAAHANTTSSAALQYTQAAVNATKAIARLRGVSIQQQSGSTKWH